MGFDRCRKSCPGYCASEVMAVVRALLLLAAVRLVDGVRRQRKRSGCSPVTVQQDFNLTRYVSAAWYPQQQMSVQYLPPDSFNCVTASYGVKERPSFFGWTVDVRNRAVNDDGSTREGDLCAYTPDSSEPAKLAVAPCFLPTFAAGPYWILAYNEEEGYALVSGGQPTIQTDSGCQTGTGVNNAGLWVFTREVFPSDDLVAKVRGIAEAQGFDLSVLKDVRHEGCSYS